MNLKRFISIFLFLFFSGCVADNFVTENNTEIPALIEENSILPSPTFTPLLTRIPSPTPIVPDSDWIELHPGLEMRTLNLLGPQNTVNESIFILRITPDLFRFEVHHQTAALSLEDWVSQTGADAVINGGYFIIDEELYYPTGLVVTNGTPYGVSYGDFAGMFTVTGENADLQWLAQSPYNPEKPVDFALQSFPILVKPGGQLGFPAEYEDNRPARRTVLAKDQSGKILLILTQKSYFTLHTLSMFLTGSDLNLDIAVNLDGGLSTGLLIQEPYIKIPAGTLLPFVISIHRK